MPAKDNKSQRCKKRKAQSQVDESNDMLVGSEREKKKIHIQGNMQRGVTQVSGSGQEIINTNKVSALISKS